MDQEQVLHELETPINVEQLHPKYLRPFLLTLELRTLRTYNEDTIREYVNTDSQIEWLQTKNRLILIIEQEASAQVVLEKIPKGELIEFLCYGEEAYVWWAENGPLTDKQLEERVVKQCFEWARHWNYEWD